MSTLYLIRHGQACFGSEDYDRLSPLGCEQVAMLRDHLRTLGVAPHEVWSGSLRRQVHTADILNDDSAPPPRVERGFDEYRAEPLVQAWLAGPGRETSLARWQDNPQRASPRDYQRLLEAAGLAWIHGELDADAPELWPAFRKRVGAGLAAVMRSAGRGRRVAICTSAGVIGAALGHVLTLDDRQALSLSWSVYNASLTVLVFDERRTSLSSFNALPHLDKPGLQRLITYR